MDTGRNIFSHGHFQNVDSALAESASIGPGGALGKLPRWGYLVHFLGKFSIISYFLEVHNYQYFYF